MFDTRDLELLNLPRLPAILNRLQAAALIGIRAHNVPLLVEHRVLVPLAPIRPGVPLRFDLEHILEVGSNFATLDRLVTVLDSQGEA